jgi:TolA-binding protein
MGFGNDRRNGRAGDGAGAGAAKPPASSNARADGLDDLTAGLAGLLATHGARAAPDPMSQVRSVVAIRDRLATRARRQRLALTASWVLGIVALTGLGTRTLRARRTTQLSYTVDRDAAPRDGLVPSPSVDAPLLAFSDGTRIQMMPRARARVVQINQHGARIRIEEGRAHVEVAHRAGAAWQIEAGAFRIDVHGTAFFVEWNTAHARLDVQMENGVVSIHGPRANDDVVLRAGQSLSISTREPAPAASLPALGTATAPAPDSGRPHVGAPEPPARDGAPPAAPGVGWPERVADGQAAAVVAEAHRRGVPRVLAHSSSEDLAALADAARYQRRDALARRALLAQRRRFPGSARAAEASFLLGRLDDRDAGDGALALSWYDRYLRDAPRGPYAAEALGRKMMVLERQHRDAEARAVAADYLRRFPDGNYAHAARAIVPTSP